MLTVSGQVFGPEVGIDADLDSGRCRCAFLE